MKFQLGFLALVLAFGAQAATSESSGAISMELTRVFTFSGSEVYSLKCPETGNKKCELKFTRNGYHISSVFMPKQAASQLVKGFRDNMKAAKAVRRKGSTPLLRWQLSLDGNTQQGAIAEEEIENGDVDRLALLNVNGLESRFTAMLMAKKK